MLGLPYRKNVFVCVLSLLSAAWLVTPEVLPQGILPPVIFTQGKDKKPLNEVYPLSSQKYIFFCFTSSAIRQDKSKGSALF